MGDLLEKFILDHQSDFDDLEPSDKIWKGIEEGIEPRKVDWSVLWKVAAVLFLCSTIYLSLDRNFTSNTGVEVAETQKEFYEAEKYYFQLISDKKSELDKMNITEKNADLMIEEQELDKIYQSLKAEYLDKHSSDMLRDVLVENLRLRIKILSNQIEVLNGFNEENYDSEYSEI